MEQGNLEIQQKNMVTQLKWKPSKFANQVLKKLVKAHENAREPLPFSDATIVCREGIIRIHSVILLASSQLLKNIMEDMKPCERDEIVIHMSEYDIEDVAAVVECMYTGKCIFPALRIQQVLEIFESFGIDSSPMTPAPATAAELTTKTFIRRYLMMQEMDEQEREEPQENVPAEVPAEDGGGDGGDEDCESSYDKYIEEGEEILLSDLASEEEAEIRNLTLEEVRADRKVRRAGDPPQEPKKLDQEVKGGKPEAKAAGSKSNEPAPSARKTKETTDSTANKRGNRSKRSREESPTAPAVAQTNKKAKKKDTKSSSKTSEASDSKSASKEDKHEDSDGSTVDIQKRRVLRDRKQSESPTSSRLTRQRVKESQASTTGAIETITSPKLCEQINPKQEHAKTAAEEENAGTSLNIDREELVDMFKCSVVVKPLSKAVVNEYYRKNRGVISEPSSLETKSAEHKDCDSKEPCEKPIVTVVQEQTGQLQPALISVRTTSKASSSKSGDNSENGDISGNHKETSSDCGGVSATKVPRTKRGSVGRPSKKKNPAIISTEVANGQSGRNETQGDHTAEEDSDSEGSLRFSQNYADQLQYWTNTVKQCSICNKDCGASFKADRCLGRHGLFRCWICLEVCKNLEQHFKKKHESSSHQPGHCKCPLCPVILEHADVRRHISNVHISLNRAAKSPDVVDEATKLSADEAPQPETSKASIEQENARKKGASSSTKPTENEITHSGPSKESSSTNAGASAPENDSRAPLELDNSASDHSAEESLIRIRPASQLFEPDPDEADELEPSNNLVNDKQLGNRETIVHNLQPYNAVWPNQDSRLPTTSSAVSSGASTRRTSQNTSTQFQLQSSTSGVSASSPATSGSATINAPSVSIFPVATGQARPSHAFPSKSDASSIGRTHLANQMTIKPNISPSVTGTYTAYTFPSSMTYTPSPTANPSERASPFGQPIQNQQINLNYRGPHDSSRPSQPSPSSAAPVPQPATGRKQEGREVAALLRGIWPAEPGHSQAGGTPTAAKLGNSNSQWSHRQPGPSTVVLRSDSVVPTNVANPQTAMVPTNRVRNPQQHYRMAHPVQSNASNPPYLLKSDPKSNHAYLGQAVVGGVPFKVLSDQSLSPSSVSSVQNALGMINVPSVNFYGMGSANVSQSSSTSVAPVPSQLAREHTPSPYFIQSSMPTQIPSNFRYDESQQKYICTNCNMGYGDLENVESHLCIGGPD